MKPETLSNPELWQRVSCALLPYGADGRAFAARLAEVAGLGLSTARRLEFEYRRFLYLSALNRAPLMASAPIWIAWEFHGEHDGFDDGFCAHILECPMPPLAAPFPALAPYQATLEAYTREFAAAPPRDIWPPASAQTHFLHEIC